MTAPVQYAVFLFPGAIVELGAALDPYLQDCAAGKHVVCSEIDAGGALFEMHVRALDGNGASVELEIMVPVVMFKVATATENDGQFGFARLTARADTPASPQGGKSIETPASVPENAVVS